MLTPCLVGTGQQALNILPEMEVTDYKKVRDVILQTLNSEAYRKRLYKIEFSLDYHLQLTEKQTPLPN